MYNLAYQDVNIYKLKNNYSSKRSAKKKFKTSHCNNMGNAEKNCIRIPKFRVCQYLFFRYPLLFKNFTNLQ